jgi:hypothetical protein
MCTKNTKELNFNNQLTLQDPKKFFDVYWNKNHNSYIDEREIIYVIEKNSNDVLNIFLKCVLKRYLRENNQNYIFNTCPRCGKLKFVFVEESYTFGEPSKKSPKKLKNLSSTINETINNCNESNHPLLHPLKSNEKFVLRFFDHDHISKFFNHYSTCLSVEIYWCEHENLTIYHKCGNILAIYSEKDLFYYINYFLKCRTIFNQCPDCNKISVNKENCYHCKPKKCNCDSFN